MKNATERCGEDETVEAFLQFLERDLAAHPERLICMPEELYDRLLSVTEGVNINADDPIEGPVAV